MNKTCKSILILVTLIILLFLYLFNSNFIIDCILQYSYLFITKVFPASFLFITISSILLDFGIIKYIEKIIHINSSNIYLFFSSMISGFPSGSIYTKKLLEDGYIDINMANKYIMFSHFPNPLFVLGSVNTIINDSYLSFSILISIIISNFIIMLFVSKKNIISNNYIIDNNFSKSLLNAINNSFNSIITIYGISIFFYLISCIITKYINLYGYSYIFTNGLFDLTSGVFSTSIISSNIIRCLFIILFICFGSISIHIQTSSILSNTKIRYKYFFIGRIISLIITIIIFYMFIVIKKDLYF